MREGPGMSDDFFRWKAHRYSTTETYFNSIFVKFY